jgi:hypothetical protein
MSRRYGQPVMDVRTTPGVSPPAEEVHVQCEPDEVAAPGRFVWRGRLYLVRRVLAHWIEVGPWWRDLTAADHRDREVWRVEAAAGRQGITGTYDLCREGTERWVLVRSYD